MKPFAGGGLFTDPTEAARPTAPQCLSYVLSQPGVATAVPGVKCAAELQAALRYCEAGPAERDDSALIAERGWNPDGACTYCNHCTPCTQGIAIGKTMRLLDLATRGVTVALRAEYLALPGAPASACVACGKCRARCPFGVEHDDAHRTGGRGLQDLSERKPSAPEAVCCQNLP